MVYIEHKNMQQTNKKIFKMESAFVNRVAKVRCDLQVTSVTIQPRKSSRENGPSNICRFVTLRLGEEPLVEIPENLWFIHAAREEELAECTELVVD